MSTPTRGKQRRRGVSNRRVSRIIRNHIHQSHLNSPPTWFESPGSYKPPPPLINAPLYFLKIRVLGTCPATGELNITSNDLSTTFASAFGALSVKRMDIWGPTDDGTLAIQANNPPTGNTQPRRFYSSGVLGEKRPYISVQISNKDIFFHPNADNFKFVSIQLFNTKGEQVAGDIIADIHTTFSSTSGQVEQSTSLLSPNFIRLQRPSLSSSALTETFEDLSSLSATLPSLHPK